MRHVATALAIVAVAVFTSAASATVIRIDCDGGGDYWTIQGAINNASHGDTLLVAPGVYVGGWNRNIDPLGLSLLIMSEEGPENTIIDIEDDPKSGFLFRNGEGPDTIVEGFTITRPYQSPGIRCKAGSSPTVRNCIITGCYNIYGGGVYCYEGSSPTFQDCVISGNTTAQEGAGLFCSDNSNPIVERCIFEGNTAGSWGGGVCVTYDCAPLFVDCVIAGNTSGQSGGGVYCGDSSPTFSECVISDNESVYGGGLRARSYSSLAIENSLFLRNYASDEGGGLQCSFSDVSITGCTFVANESPDGSALFVDINVAVDMHNSILAFNVDGWAAEGVGDQVVCHCTNVYGNAGVDWGWALSGQYPGNGNQRAEPMFCMGNNPGDPYTLHSSSPCAPDNSGGCGLIGARPVGCGTTPVLDVTWGAIKRMYR